jgi:hypothetical protein
MDRQTTAIAKKKKNAAHENVNIQNTRFTI